MPSVLLAVDGSARTFNCVVVVPSTLTVTVVSATLGVETACSGVCVVDGGMGVAGSVAVTKSGVAVIAPSLEIFTAQPEHMRITARRGKIYLCFTSLL